MNLFGFTILRTERLQDIHRRNRNLDSVNNGLTEILKSQEAHIEQQEEKIEAYKVKTSRVEVSKLINRIEVLKQALTSAVHMIEHPHTVQFPFIKNLKRTLYEKEMPDTELSALPRNEAGVLPQSLVQAVGAHALGDNAIILTPEPPELLERTPGADKESN